MQYITLTKLCTVLCSACNRSSVPTHLVHVRHAANVHDVLAQCTAVPQKLQIFAIFLHSSALLVQNFLRFRNFRAAEFRNFAIFGARKARYQAIPRRIGAVLTCDRDPLACFSVFDKWKHAVEVQEHRSSFCDNASNE